MSEHHHKDGHKTRRRIDRRSFLKLSGVSAGALALAACQTGGAGEGPHGSKKVQLVYQDWRTDWFPGMAQSALETFHAANPDIQVFFTPDPENLMERMTADFQAGTAPDVLAGCCDFFPIWAQQGYLLDLRPFVEADLDRETLADWDPAQYAALFTSDGFQYALPKYHGALGIYYNKDLFDHYGVLYPESGWTHDDYLEIMKRLTKDRDGDGETDLWGSMLDISWERIQVHVNSWGGHFVDPEDHSRSWMARPEALDAMSWIHDRMWKDRVMASFLDVQNLETREAFIQQHVAMVEDGSWALKDILERADFRIGIAPFPAGPMRQVTLATTDGFAIYAGTKYPEAAWEILKFLTSKEYGRAMAQAHFLQPSRSSLVEDWVQMIRQEFPSKSVELDVEAFAEGHVKGYSVTAEIFANMAEARRIAKAAWQRIFTLNQDPVESMIQVSTAIEQSQPSR